MFNIRQRQTFFFTISVFFLLLTTYYLHLPNPIPTTPHNASTRPGGEGKGKADVETPPATSLHPPFKPISSNINPPIIDNFPLAAAAHSAAELPPIPEWNLPPGRHVREKTPLFIGFTRNWRLLQQTVVSYITAGWPPSDIYVVENTGVMDSNKRGLLSLQNPFFLNHTRLDMLGVNVITTPTLFTFAQLQNFYLWTSIQEKYTTYFWSHMDVVAVSYEDRNTPQFSSIYTLALSELRNVTDPSTAPWAIRFFAYDRLALVNVAAFEEVGGWDTMIPFYLGDCDMHSRLTMAGFSQEEREAGLVFDVGSSLDDLIVLYRKKDTVEASFTDPNLEEIPENAVPSDIRERSPFNPFSSNTREWEDDTLSSPAWHKLVSTCDAMQRSKNSAKNGRNTWQARQTGGKGDPYYRDPEGFEQAIQMTIEHGRAVYREKWGHRDCDIVQIGLKPDEAWRVKHDWD